MRAVLIGVIVLWASLPARAQEPRPLDWQPEWRRVSLLEGLALIPVGVALLLIETQWKPPEEPRWEGGILFDDAARDLVRGRSREAQTAGAELSDFLYLWGSALPVVLDVGVVALGVHRNPDLALQLLLIDLQSLSVAGLVALTAEHSVGRGRPYVEDCGPDGIVRDASGEPLRNSCGHGNDAKSFFSGHAAMTATVAGLTCVHHQRLPLYGGGFADLAPCLLTIGVSITTGIGRMVADMHWASDVIVGWGVGAFAGYVLPSLLHYDWPAGPRSTVALVPLASGAALSWSGVL